MYLIRCAEGYKPQGYEVDNEEVIPDRPHKDKPLTLPHKSRAWRWEAGTGGWSALGRDPEEAWRLLREIMEGERAREVA